METDSIATRIAFGQELLNLALHRKDFVVCNADTKTCSLEKFGEAFPERAFSLGIAEQNLVGCAAGLASCGNKVYLATFAVFACMRACEQIRTFICYPNLNVTIIGTHVGLQVGGDGATHAAIEDVSIMRALPNMTIVQPSDAVSARAIARATIDFSGPLYVRLHRNAVRDIHCEGDFQFEIGKSYIIADYGDDIAIIVSGILLQKALDAAIILKQKGIQAKVVEMPTIKPIDKQTILDLASCTHAIMTIEDHTIYGGLGSAVSEVLVQYTPVHMCMIGIRDRFGESGDSELLYRDHGMDVDSIVQKAMFLVKKKAQTVTLDCPSCPSSI